MAALREELARALRKHLAAGTSFLSPIRWEPSYPTTC
jgi:hypothetical protein